MNQTELAASLRAEGLTLIHNLLRARLEDKIAMDEVSKMLPTTPGEPPNGHYEYIDRGSMGNQMQGWYSNNYGVSVVRGPYSYGGSQGLFELAVLHGRSLEDCRLCYATTVTTDVRGHLTEEEVVALMHQVAKLEANEDCDHGHSGGDLFDEDSDHDLGDAMDSLLGNLRLRAFND